MRLANEVHTMSKDTGGPAFPTVDANREEDYGSRGMTLRDYFAAKAMAALSPTYWETQDEYESGKDLIKCLAESAYEMADAMLVARVKP
ncbi:hypothetical protein CQW31_29680 [Pseudomonas sp. 382]|nr:hypothetical protein CQW31_29680 [Pseudomonas sp. 382]